MRSLVFLLLGAAALDYHAPATLDENDDVREEDEESLSEVTAEAEIASLQAKIRDQVAAIAATHAEIERVKAQLEEKDSDDSEKVSTATGCGGRLYMCTSRTEDAGCTSQIGEAREAGDDRDPQVPEEGVPPFSMDGIPGKGCGCKVDFGFANTSTGAGDWKAHENASSETQGSVEVYRISAAPKYTSNINVANIDGMCGVRDTLTWLFTEQGDDQWLMTTTIRFRGRPTRYGLCNGGKCEDSDGGKVDKGSFGMQPACGDYGKDAEWYSLVGPEWKKWEYAAPWTKRKLDTSEDWVNLSCKDLKRAVLNHFQ